MESLYLFHNSTQLHALLQNGTLPVHTGPFHVRKDVAGALVMGLIYGVVHVVGPDHLGTLITLSSSALPGKAFRTGAAWGLGHSLGMAILAAFFLLMHRVLPLDFELWEHYGNYCIGVSLVACGAYFVTYEAAFISEGSDGRIVAKGCPCHPVPAPVPMPPTQECGEVRGSAEVVCGECDYGAAGGGGRVRMQRRGRAGSAALIIGHSAGCCGDCGEEACSALEAQPLVAAEPAKPELEASMGRDTKGALLGMLQGLCCPVGVVGVSCLANLRPTGIAVFLVVFMCVSAFGTASVAMLWAWLTARGLGNLVSPLTAYRASCGFTLLLGVLWVAATYFGFVESLDYAESLI